MGPGFCISSRFPGDADTSGPTSCHPLSSKDKDEDTLSIKDEHRMQPVITGLEMFPSEFGPVVCKTPPCLYLTKASKRRGFCPPDAIAVKGEAMHSGGHPGGVAETKSETSKGTVSEKTAGPVRMSPPGKCVYFRLAFYHGTVYSPP